MSYTDLPADLPAPEDDGACDHLAGRRMPSLRLPATIGDACDLGALPQGRSVIFIYPMTGTPGIALPDGWNDIPGARGCTPQNCAIRDLHREFAVRDVAVFGLSAQSPQDQAEAAARLHLPYPLLSDRKLELAEALDLPTFEVDGRRLIRRLTLVVREGVVEHVFYPVFPPDRSADQVLAWLATQAPDERYGHACSRPS